MLTRAARLAYHKAYYRERKEYFLAYQKHYRKANRLQVNATNRKYHPWFKYGISREEYEAIIAAPCGLCGTDEKKRELDHDHKTGRVRGGLCWRCNISLGHLETHDSEWLKKALAWIGRKT